jgi:hypothetical protein
MITRIQSEIVQLHQFFQDWYNGKLPHNGAAFQRCEDVLAPGFTMVPPNNGKVLERLPLLGVLWNLHEAKVGIEFWIEDIQIRHQNGNAILATYQEWQKYNRVVTARLSSALFEKAHSTPNGVHWLHVHETWIDLDKP